MAHSDFIVDSLKGSAYTAGLCALFGWADPKAAALGGLAAKVSGAALRSAANYLWIPPTPSDKENQYSVAEMIVNIALIITPIVATVYAANYVGQQIDIDYSYAQTSFKEFRVYCVLGLGSFALGLLFDESPQKSVEPVISKEELKTAAPELDRA